MYKSFSSYLSRFSVAFLILALLVAAVPVSTVFAADTGWNSPSSCASTTWGTPANALTSNDVRTSAGGDGDQLICSFNLPAIPAGNSIVGIEVRVEGNHSFNSSRDASVDLSWDGTNYTGGDEFVDLVNGEVVLTVGGTNDTWGRTWATTEFSAANFRVRVYNDNDTGTSNVDHVQVRVTYFPPQTITASAGANGSISPSGAVLVNYGTNQSFSSTPNIGYIVSDVLVDGGSVGRANAYTFNNVTADHTISASFDGGWTQPSTNGGGAWATEGNGYVSDNAYAVANDNNDVAVYCGFGLTVPANSAVGGIEVAIEGYSTGSREIDVDLSWDGGATFTGGNPDTNFGGTETTLVLGGSSFTWGRSWLVTDLSNANFCVEFDATTGGGDVNVDQIQVRVTYVPAAEVDVQGNGISITDGDTTPSIADHTDFGDVPRNFFVERTFTIYNTDPTTTLNIGTVTFTGGEAGDFSLTTAPASSVAPGGSTTFTVRLTAGNGADDTINTTINFTTNDAEENPFDFNMQGNRITAGIDVQGNGATINDGDTTPSLNDHTHFGNTSLGTPVTRTYTIVNTSGTQTLYLGTVNIGGANAGDFTVTSAPSATVAPNGTTTLTVQFNPSATGTRNASISFINNDNNESPYNFNIQGTVLPEIDVQGNGISIADGDGSPSTTDDTDWGMVAVGTNVDHTFTIYNTGFTNLTLSTPTLTGSTSFTVLTPPTSPVPPGGSTIFVIRFSPSAAGGPIKDATVSITNNDPNENPYTFDITGSRPIPEIDIQGNGISINDGDFTPSIADGTNWGNVGTNIPVDHTFTIYNTGQIDLTLSNPTITNIIGAPTGFTILTPPAGIVPAGGSTTVVIRFQPTAAGGGTKTALFSVDNNDLDEDPYTFFITGTRITGAEADVQGNGLSIADDDTTPSVADDTDFGNVNVGSSSTHTFTIYNYGASDLTVTNLTVTGNFSITSAPTSPVTSGGSTTFDVQFTPSGLGVQNGTISFDNNDTGTENPYNFSLTGTGIDLTLPDVTVEQASGQVDPTNVSPINFTVTFSEPIALAPFVGTNLTIGGTAGATTAVISEIAPNNGTTFNVAVSGMTVNGTVILSLDASMVTDVAGNGNTASTSVDNTVTYDATAPDTQIDTSPANPDNNLSPAFTFSSPDADVASFECQMDGVGGFVACVSGDVFGPLTAGSHTFEVRVIDTAGNVDTSPASYTWLIDTAYPYVLFDTNTTPAQNSSLEPGVMQITISYSKDVKNDASAGAANNTANYLLVEDGTNNTFDTVSCQGGLGGDDTPITVNSATYTNNGGTGPFIATLVINNGFTTPSGKYRLFICGTTSIEDLAGSELNNGATDAQLDFTIITLARLPKTGFPQGQVTSLPAQPAELAYASYSDLWLEIPKLKVKTSIVGVPSTSDGWNVNWLNKDAGWLNGSAFPTWAGNSVITAHVWDALNKPGPFAGLKNLQYGDQVKVHAFGQVFTYEIRETKTVSPTSTYTVFRHEDKSWITLITCEDYKEGSQTYSHRRMVRAVLISVASE